MTSEHRTSLPIEGKGSPRSTRHFTKTLTRFNSLNEEPRVQAFRDPHFRRNRIRSSVGECELAPKQDRESDSGFPVTTISSRGKSHGLEGWLESVTQGCPWYPPEKVLTLCRKTLTLDEQWASRRALLTDCYKHQRAIQTFDSSSLQTDTRVLKKIGQVFFTLRDL